MDLTLAKHIREATDAITATPKKKKMQKRSYNAARVNRLTSDWITGPTTANQILRGDLRSLRSRSRDLARNDPYAKKILSLLSTNIIGTGVNLQIKFSGKSYTSDNEQSNYIESVFKDWQTKEFCSTSQKLNWLALQHLAVKNLARDGEVIIRKIYDPANPYGISLKYYSGDWLDETYNSTASNGNRIIMSVEVDNFERPVAFWLCPPVSDYMYQRTRKRVRVPASEIYHIFLITEDEEQSRGVPWLHASMLRLKMLDGYEEAELVAARVEACNMGFFIPPEDQNLSAENEDDDGNSQMPIEEAEPGIFAELPSGYDLKTFEPQHPNANSLGFKKGALRGVSSGSDISYHSIAGDLESVNYSSARIGSLEDRDFYQIIQQFFIEYFHQPIFNAWKESAFLTGALDIPERDYDRIKAVFRARGWQWVDPKKDADAAVIGLSNNFLTLTDVLAEKGIDIQDFFETKKKEMELAEEFGITLEFGKPSNNKPEMTDEDS